VTRRIRIRFPAEQVSAEAELRWEEAPKTCRDVTATLPVEAMTHHGIYSGSEIVFELPVLLRTAPENATSKVTKGDVGFTWMAAGSSYGVKRDFAEICWFYDIDAEPRMWDGPVAVSLFARIVEPASEFYALCRRMRREGIKPCRVEVVES
jgi:hypothetical protein